MRDRRWDFLYERQKQPVKAYVLTRFAQELATELQGWPPPFVDWVSDELQARWQAGISARPREGAIRLALLLARLDLTRQYEAYEAELERGRAGLQPAEEAALHLLVVLLTERCLGLKEHAEAIRLTRPDLSGALEDVEKRLFRVTLG
ncbi:MAG: hypothetical protein QM767_23375 [Anaeromyxobacter sp.]